MADILTITLNPAVDVATTTARIAPEHKLRCTPERRDPGGGGINAARVIHRLGGDVLAALVAGGPIGQLLQSLLAQEGLPALVIPASGDTRESFTIIETDTGREYRFVLPGPLMPERERDAAIAALTPSLMSARFVVCGGSLPPGAPDDTYAALADIARRGGGKFALDASGAALQAALAKRVYLVKPSLRELQDLCGRPLQDSAAILRAARDLIESAQAEIVAVTLGARGALVVTQTQTWRADALPVRVASSVGAGDSFLGAMVWSLAAGHDLETAFRYAMAASAASLGAPGTQLCQRSDVMRLAAQVTIQKA